MLQMQPSVTRQFKKLAKAATRADIDTGFEYMDLCEPILVLSLIAAVKQVVPADPELVQVETLAKAACGERLISDAGMAFEEVCEPELILNWCQLVGAVH